MSEKWFLVFVTDSLKVLRAVKMPVKNSHPQNERKTAEILQKKSSHHLQTHT
jgi:hypothetical protein